MVVRPKRWVTGEFQIVGTHPLIYLECEVTAPPSMEGRSVTFVLDARDRDDLLKELRSIAIEARR